MIFRLSGYLLLTLGLLPALVLSFELAVWASENAIALSSPRTAWKEVDLAYERLFLYDQSRQPHPPAGCVVLPAISHNSYKQSTGITTRRAILMLRCRERINLLRPARWVRSRLRAQNRQGYLLVSMPEMGIMDVQVHVVAVKSSAFNPATVAMRSASSRPVIGLFIRHTTNVRQYTFKDTLTGKVDRVKATPNHPFYVVNQQRYIPVSDLSMHDQLLNVLGHTVTVVCPKGKTSHCGRPYRPGQVIRVYNLEVYGQHRYFVGEPGIMVHNVYTCRTCGARFYTEYHYLRHKITYAEGTDEGLIKRSHMCHICYKSYSHSGSLSNHLKSHLSKKPYECTLCRRGFLRKAWLDDHKLSKMHLKNQRIASADVSSEASGSTEGTKLTRARFRSSLTKLLSQEIAKFCRDVTPGKVSDYFDIPDLPEE